MENIGIDVHKMESQICIDGEWRGGRAAHQGGAGAIRRDIWRKAARGGTIGSSDRWQLISADA